MTISITTKSYPYLALTQDWDIPYWVVLGMGEAHMAEAASEWLIENMPFKDRQEFYLTLREVTIFAQRSLREGFAILKEGGDGA